MRKDVRPTIAVTMGDPAGIGPEVVIKVLLSGRVFEFCRPVVVGASSVVEKTLAILGGRAKVNRLSGPGRSAGNPGEVDLIDMENIDESGLVFGSVSAACGRASMEWIDKAARLAAAREVAAIVTAPINKEATALAGYHDVGHLEYLARITGSKEYATMLVSGVLRTVHLTTHHSLVEACGKVKRERILARLKLTDVCFRTWGFSNPRIGVAALNPHGGERGMMGREEIEEIEPAVRAATAEAIDARGPFPADSIFNRAIEGEFDVVLAMYHDQGHIPVKVHGLAESVSVALGLPFIRTSVDHGTAFDIAGRGIADARSMEEAIKVAVSLAERGRLL